MVEPSPNSGDGTSPKRICEGCVGESYLKRLIASDGAVAECSYCEEESKTYTIERLADLIEGAFDAHYERTSTEPDSFEAAMMSDRESNYHWERHGQPVLWAIVDVADISEGAARDVLSVLQDRHFDHESAKMGEESEFDDDSHYEEKHPGCDELSWSWWEFERRLKTERRYFSGPAHAILEEVFAGLAALRTREGTSVIVEAGPGTALGSVYRARVFAAEDDKLELALKYPWLHLGPPPIGTARAGRMNAQGVSVFYGAVDATTALAEVRPPVGSKVAVARFTIDRPLKLLDVQALKAVIARGSVFDPAYVGQLQRARFLEILSGRITRPVMPNEEALEYLATQVIADYLAAAARLDGIMFPSVQVGQGNSNITLFHHASRLAEVEIPKQADVTASLQQQDSDRSEEHTSELQ